MFSIVQVILALTLQVSLRRIKKILVAGYFDDLITMNITHGSCWENILKITFIKTKLCYTPSESSFQPLSGNCIFRVCDHFNKSESLTRTFSSSFIAVPYGKLYNKSLESCKTKSLGISDGSFDKNNACFQGSNPGYLIVETLTLSVPLITWLGCITVIK